MSGEETQLDEVCQPTWSLYPTHHASNKKMHAWLDSDGLLPPDGLKALRRHLKWIQFKQRFLEAELKVAMQKWFPAPKHMEEDAQSVLFETEIPEHEYATIAANLVITIVGPSDLYLNGKKMVLSHGYLLNRIEPRPNGLKTYEIQRLPRSHELDVIRLRWPWAKYLGLFAGNPSLTLPVLKAYPYLPWDLAHIFKNGNLPWKFLCILRDMYRPFLRGLVNLWSHLCANPSLDLKKLEDIPEDQRDYMTLLLNSNIDLNLPPSYFRNYNRPFYLAHSRFLTPEIVEQHPDFPWKSYISIHPNFTWEWIQNHPAYDWNPDEVSANPNITWEIIQNNPHFFTSYQGVIRNPTIPLKDLIPAGIQQKWETHVLTRFIPQPWDEMKEMSTHHSGDDSLSFFWKRRVSWFDKKHFPLPPGLFPPTCFEAQWRKRLNEVEQLILRRLGQHQAKEFYYQLVEKLSKPGKYYYQKDVKEFEELLSRKRRKVKV